MPNGNAQKQALEIRRRKYRVEIDRCRPAALRRRDMLRLLPSPKILQRLVWAMRHGPDNDRWLVALQEGAPGRELLIKTESFETAIDRMYAGEQPPRMPSEPVRTLVSAMPVEKADTAQQ